MSNREAYITLCKEMDNMLVDSGIRATCIKCSTGGIEERETKLLSRGCCSGCQYLGEEGCTSISLGCKVWFCSIMGEKFEAMLKEKGHLKRFKEIRNRRQDLPFYVDGVRATVNEIFLVKIGDTIS